MEWGDEEATQESAGPLRLGHWVAGPDRGRKAGQSRKPPQRRVSPKPREKTCGLAQCQTPTTATLKQRLGAAVALIRSRFGYGAVGLGCSGIRYSAATLY